MRVPRSRGAKPSQRPEVVLGTQMAAAIEAEKRHQSVPQDPSPLTRLRYEQTRGELDLFRFVECPTDDAVGSVIEAAFGAASDALSQLRAALTQADLYTLLTFSRRRALSALRQDSADPLPSGFRALALVDLERIDWRDAVVAAGLLAYAGGRVGVPVQELVSEINQRAQPAIAEVLATHTAVPEEGLAVGGYREIRTPHGVGLANDYGHPYAPTVDLVSLAENVLALVERDKYRAKSLTTGSDLPPVWLPAAGADTAHARERLRGCMFVSARPKDDRRGMPDQMFSVWIAEAASPRDAHTIASAAVPRPGSEIAILGVASGTVCAVAVARSVFKGVRAIEDMESIERFRADLNAAVTPS